MRQLILGEKQPSSGVQDRSTKPRDLCTCAPGGLEHGAGEGPVRAKGSEWALRAGPGAGESGQWLQLTTTQPVSSREGRRVWKCMCGKRWRRKVFYHLKSLMLDLDPSSCCLCSGSPSNPVTNYSQRDVLRKANFPIHDPLLPSNTFTDWALFQEGSDSLTLAPGAPGVQPHSSPPSLLSPSVCSATRSPPCTLPGTDFTAGTGISPGL